MVFTGELQPWVGGKDIVLKLLERWGARSRRACRSSSSTRERQLPMAYRNTIANMMAEAEAQNGIFAPDEITYAWYRDKGMTDLPYPEIGPGADARYAIDETLDLGEIQPMIAKPFSPGNAHPAAEVAREKIEFDKAYIGSCTNGSYDDLLQAALVLRAGTRGGPRRGGAALRHLPRLGRRQAPDREPRPAPRRRVDRRRAAFGRRPDPRFLVRPLLRPGRGRAAAGRARDHLVQSQLAEPHGSRRRGVPGQPGRCRRLGASRLHGPRRASSGWTGIRSCSGTLAAVYPAVPDNCGPMPGTGPRDQGLQRDRGKRVARQLIHLVEQPTQGAVEVVVAGPVAALVEQAPSLSTRLGSKASTTSRTVTRDGAPARR